MELGKLNLNIMDIPPEIRARIIRTVTDKTAFTLRRTSKQLKADVESFHNFSFHLDDKNPKEMKAKLKLQMKRIEIVSLTKPIISNHPSFLKYPYAVLTLCINNSRISPTNYSILIKECGQFLKTFEVSPVNLLNKRGNIWEFPLMLKSLKHTLYFKNVQRFCILDKNWYLRDLQKERVHNEIVLHFLEIPLSLTKLKVLNVHLHRVLTVKAYVEIEKQIFAILAQQCEHLEEFVLSLDIGLKMLESPQIRNRHSRYADKLKKLHLSFRVFNPVVKYVSVDAFLLLLNCQQKLADLYIFNMPCLKFNKLMEVVGKNSNTLQTLKASLSHIQDSDESHEETERLEISAFGHCLNLLTIDISGIRTLKTKEIICSSAAMFLIQNTCYRIKGKDRKLMLQSVTLEEEEDELKVGRVINGIWEIVRHCSTPLSKYIQALNVVFQ